MTLYCDKCEQRLLRIAEGKPIFTNKECPFAYAEVLYSN